MSPAVVRSLISSGKLSPTSFSHTSSPLLVDTHIDWYTIGHNWTLDDLCVDNKFSKFN